MHNKTEFNYLEKVHTIEIVHRNYRVRAERGTWGRDTVYIQCYYPSSVDLIAPKIIQGLRRRDTLQFFSDFVEDIERDVDWEQAGENSAV